MKWEALLLGLELLTAAIGVSAVGATPVVAAINSAQRAASSQKVPVLLLSKES